jgi:hypothetical protein
MFTKNYGKIHPFFMGKLTISMATFNSYVTNYQRVNCVKFPKHIAMEGGLLRILGYPQPQILHFKRIFHAFPTILGYHHFGKHHVF